MKYLTLFSFLLINFSLSAQYLHERSSDLPCVNKHFNVAVHIALDKAGEANITLEEIELLFTEANVYFEPICFSFGICSVDTLVNYSNDTLSLEGNIKVMEHFHKDNMLNLFMVTQVFSNNGCHEANFFGIKEPSEASMLLNKRCGGKDLAHVIGHLFGLRDTFGGGELVDGSNCDTHGDRLCDTPADPYTFSVNTVWLSKCKFINESKDINGDFYEPDIGNLMSLYRDCRCGFSRQQYELMVANFKSINYTLW
jgi:hypothetical protein